VTRPRLDRREFLRVAALGTFAVAAACSDEPDPRPGATSSPSGSGSGSPSPSATGPFALGWKLLPAKGPGPRREHSFTANDGGTIAFLFGGRAGGKPLTDLWAFDRAASSWQQLTAAGGPSARFGHSAAFVDGHLVVFGGQGNGNTFFNDSFAFDPVHGTWTKLNPAGGPPAPRYGAGGTRIGTSLTISHGFTNTGRFDDTWALSARWTDVSPRSGARPIKRCLHRSVYLPALGRMILFGGQTDGRPFLGDTWLYDPTKQGWTQAGGSGPTARNLYAFSGTDSTAFLFGGATGEGPSNELWSFDRKGWKKLRPIGTPPSARGGVDGTIVAGPSLLVFGGGAPGAGELADLWELTIPV
jgi:hypothetical protein